MLGLLSIEHNVVFPAGHMDKEGRYYLNHPRFAPIREALVASQPTQKVSLALSEDAKNAFMRIDLDGGYYMDMVYPTGKGFWNCVSHPNPASPPGTPQATLEECLKPAAR